MVGGRGGRLQGRESIAVQLSVAFAHPLDALQLSHCAMQAESAESCAAWQAMQSGVGPLLHLFKHEPRWVSACLEHDVTVGSH